MSMRNAVIASACLACSQTTLADQAILIGGGNNLLSTPVQIEENAQWIRGTLESLKIPTAIYFTDGDDPTADVFFEATESQYDSTLESISRVYGQHRANRTNHRSHTLENIKGSTTAQVLSTSLSQLLKQSNQATLLLFNAHGINNYEAPQQASLNLWNETSLDTVALQQIVSNASMPVRYIVNQSYSGGFNKLVFANPANGLALLDQEICGFSAEASQHTSDSFLQNKNIADAKDYTSYFLAALSGYDRNGEILPRVTDIDGDGQVSLHEAHMFSVEEAFSTDVPYSSSEYYLERWQPWYLKWLPARRSLPNNEYAKLFRSVANKHNMPLEGNTAKSIRLALAKANENLSDLTELYQSTNKQETELQQKIQAEAQTRWPELAQPYTSAYLKLVSGEDVFTISEWLNKLKAYKTLISTQEKLATVAADLLESERYATQLQKMLHLRKLASLKNQLYQYGSSQEVAGYERLMLCETSPLHASSQ